MVTIPIGPQSSGTGMTSDQETQLGDLNGLLNNMSTNQQLVGDPYVDGTDVKIDIDTAGSVDFEFTLEGVKYSESMPQTFTLVQGDDEPQGQMVGFVFDTQSQTIIQQVSTEFIEGPFQPLCYLAIKDYTRVASEGFPYLQRITEDTSHNGQGAISRMRVKSRVASDSPYWSGMELLYGSDATGANIDLTILDGHGFQMNFQSYGEKSVNTDGAYVVNTQNDTGSGVKDWDVINNVADLTKLRGGDDIAVGKFVVVNVYAILNNTPDNCKIALTPSVFEFDSITQAHQCAETQRYAQLPHQLSNVSIPIGCVILKRTATGFDNGFSTTALHDEYLWKNSNSQPSYQSFSTPNYPNNYPNGSDIRRTFTATCSANETIISIKCNFSAFNTESGYDKLYYDNSLTASTSNYNNLWQGILGSFETPSYSGSQVSFWFHSDGSVQRTGCNINTVKIYVKRVVAIGEQSYRTIAVYN